MDESFGTVYINNKKIKYPSMSLGYRTNHGINIPEKLSPCY